MKKTVSFGLLIIVLAFGFIGCSDDDDPYNNDAGDFAGTWTGIGALRTVTISNSGYTCYTTYYGNDTGKFNRNGTTITFYSNNAKAVTGTATIINSNTVSVVLNANSGMAGTYILTR